MKILFVCTGNANRSALAEVVLEKLLRQNNLSDVEVTSCGTKVPEGLERDEVMCKIAAQNGYELGGYARQMDEEILNSADIIFVMTEYHRNEVTKLLTYSNWNRIYLFNNFCFGDNSDVEDPFFQTEHIYLKCLERIEAGCKEIINRMNDIRNLRS